MTIKQAEKLITEVKKKRASVEYNVGTFKGVENLSVSDLEMAILYAEHYIASGGNGYEGLMSPTDNVQELLGKYNLPTEQKSIFGW